MTSAKAGFGVTLTFNSQAVGEILGINGIKFSHEFIDVTNHGSTGGYEESIPSAVIRSGEFTLQCNSIIGDAGQAAIKTAWGAKETETVMITFPDGEYFSGSAYVVDYEVVSEMDRQIFFNVTLKWSGAVTDSSTAATKPSNMVLTTATLYPTFAATTYDYVAVSTGDTCTLTLTFATSTAKLYREGVFVQALTTDQASGNISLGADGVVTDLQVVVSEASKADVTYNIRVANAAA